MNREKTTRVRLVDRKHTNSIKWDLMPMIGGTPEDLPLWIADMDFAVCPEVTKALRAACAQQAFGYTFQGDVFKEAVSGWFKRRHDVMLEPSWIVPCQSVLGAMQILMDALLEEGDGVMLFTPVYPPFYEITAHRKLQRNDLTIYAGEEVDWDLAETQIAKSRVVLFCNPHNPLAKVWTEEECRKLAGLCRKYQTYLFSDDVHCDMAMFGNTYHCMAQYEEVRNRLIVFTSAAKSFNLAGLGGCNLIVPDEQLRNQISGILSAYHQTELSIFSAAGIKAAYEYGDEWSDTILAYLEGNVSYVLQFLARYMPEIRCIHEGTFLMWIDCRKLGISGPVLNQMFREQHVLLDDGGRYGDAGNGFLRVNIACSRNMLKEAMKRFRIIYYKLVKGEAK